MCTKLQISIFKISDIICVRFSDREHDRPSRCEPNKPNYSVTFSERFHRPRVAIVRLLDHRPISLVVIALHTDQIQRLHVTPGRKERRKEVFHLTTHSTHFIYGYMASDIW